MSTFREWQSQESIQGIVDEVIDPGKEWRVKVYGVYWHASTLGHASFFPGERIQVLKRESNRLVIAPI